MSVPSQPSTRAWAIAASSAGFDSGYSERRQHEPVLRRRPRTRPAPCPPAASAGVALHQVLVDVGAGVALVAVGDDELLRGFAACGEPPLGAGREPGAAAAADLGLLHLLSSSSGPSSVSARRSPDQSPGAVSTGSCSRLRHSGSGGGASWRSSRDARRPRRRRRRSSRRRAPPARSGRSPGRRSRRGDSEPSRAALAERRGRAPRSICVDVRVAGRREAGGAGADADVARAARTEQIVVERRDAVDRGLGQPRHLRRAPAVLVGHLAVVLHRVLQDLERGRRIHCVMTANQLNEVLRHISPWRRGSTALNQLV